MTPVAWTDWRGKKWLIRATPTGLIVHTVRGFHRRQSAGREFLKQNPPEAIVALAKEGLTRDIGRYAKAIMTMLASPGCAVCGGPGLYIVNSTTYCRQHKSQATKRREAVGRLVDKGQSEREQMWHAHLVRRKANDAFHTSGAVRTR